MSIFTTNPAEKRYLLRFLPTIASYIILFSIVESILHRRHPTGANAIALALTPALPILAGILMVGLYLSEEQDEFKRSIFVRCLLWSLALTLSFTTVHGFLELFTPVQRFPLYAVYPLFWVIFALAQGAYSWRYWSRNE